ERDWQTGEHEVAIEITPLTPNQEQIRSLRLRLNHVLIRGPLAEEHWVEPATYAKFFPRAVPADAAAQRAYAREILSQFALRAYRRPPAANTLERLVTLAERIWSEPKNTFESGIAQAMVAVLASPSFIFREEDVQPLQEGQEHPFVDEYALASRLSYFL